MNRQSRTFVVFGLSVAFAALASYGVYRAIARIPVRNVEVATAQAVVAARPLPMGKRLAKEDVKVVAWPARTPLTNGFTSIDAVVDRGLVVGVVENEPLVESKLAPKEAGAGLPPSIQPGMRAMSVKVNEVVGVAGFVVPGTRVDVMVTIRQHDDSMSRVVVNNVQVLTAGTRYDQENTKNGKPIQSTVVTLMVTPQDAERIALAQSEGQIMLALRNPMDTEPTATSGIRTAGLLGSPSPSPQVVKPTVKRAVAVQSPEPPPEPAVVAAAAPVESPYMVEAIRGAKRTQEEVR
jgi:pilus assembly protein CpaB